MTLRPGIQAYTRAAWLRTLFGDRPGAIELLHLAARTAASADADTRSWVLAQLAAEALAANDLTTATTAARRAVEAADSPTALTIFARVAIASERLDDAAAVLERLNERAPTPETTALLAAVHAARGDRRAAEEHLAFVEHLDRVARANGHSYGRQVALIFADTGRRLPEALALARAEVATRGDVYSYDALAWALLHNGRPRAAAKAVHRARRLGTDDALFHYHAALIADRLGRRRVAVRLLRRALAGALRFDLHHAPIARATLARLTARPEEIPS